MAKLVNYKKRDITLPSGCKNLIDILHLGVTPKPGGCVQIDTSPIDEPPVVTRCESVAGRLSDIGKFMAMVYQSQSRYFVLTVSPPDERLNADIARMEDGTIEASGTVQTGTEEERAVRSFFARRGLHMPDDSGLPPQFLPNLPVHLTFYISPLPLDSLLSSMLVTDLFRDAFRFTDDSPLTFRYYEITDLVS